MRNYHSLLLTSLLLYSSASFANDNPNNTTDLTTPITYQLDLNEYSFTDNVQINSTDTLLAQHKTNLDIPSEPLALLGNHFSLTMEQLTNPISGACISYPESIFFKKFALITLTQCSNLISDQSTSLSGMLYSDHTIAFQDNVSTFFHKNIASGCGGVISAKEIAFTNTTSTVSLSENEAHQNGGALYGEKICISKQAHLALTNNTAHQSGGAIYITPKASSPFDIDANHEENECCLLENSGQANIIGNQALHGNGGAIYSTGNCTLQGMVYLRAQNNRASSPDNQLGFGGAIFCSNINTNPTPTTLNIQRNSITLFTDNTSSHSGGAIYGDQINIDQNFGVYFLRNKARQGGAISVSDIGSLSLQSGSGVIVFQENKQWLNKNNKDSQIIYNAIHLAPHAHLSHLSTSTNGGIFFYDPITQDNLPADATPKTLIMNKKSETPSGVIVFSGKFVSKEEKLFPENFTSKIHHHVTLESGDLYLEDAACLHVHSFNQAKESKLHLQPGTFLSTQEDLRITNLEIPLSALGSQDVAHISSHGAYDSSISVKGTISLLDTEQTFYENHALLNNSESWIPLVEAQATNQTDTAQIDTSPQQIQIQGDLSSQYGYQGSWDIEWRDSDQPNTKQLCAHWTKSAYIPHPERITTLVANSLWNARADLFAIHELLDMKMQAEPYSLGIWGSATSSFFHKTIDKQLPEDPSAWKHRSCGYMIGINSHSMSDHVLGFAAGQLYGRSEDHRITSEQRRSYIVSAFSKISTQFLTLSASASYNKTYHTLTTHYQAFQEEGSGDWESECFSGDISSAIVMKLQENSRLFHSVSFFAKARLFDGTQPMFNEIGKEARTFSNNYLRVLSTPVGVSFESKTKRHGMFYNASLAYSQDVYKESSINTATLQANQESWPTEMTQFDKHAFLFQISHHRTFKFVQLFANFSGEIRKNSQTYSLDLGSTCKF